MPSLKITDSEAGQRLDIFLSQVKNLASRSKVSQWIKDEKITINGKKSKPSYILEKLDLLYIPKFEYLDQKDPSLVPWDYPLNIVHEDSDVIVLNKPPGLVVHPAAGHQTDTLVNALIAHTNSLSSGSDPNRPGIVHRIDKDTSGLLVVTKNDRSHDIIARQFKNKTIHRVYHAICYGHLKEDEGFIEGYLSRHPTDRKKFHLHQESEKGKWSKTHYKVLQKTLSGLSFIELKLETGRTHQIRIHLSQMGHPIIGDELYGPKGHLKNLKSVQLRKKIKNLDRFALHATELGFIHPQTQSEVFFSQDMPINLKEFLNND